MKRNKNGSSIISTLVGLYLAFTLRTSRWSVEAEPATWAVLTRQAAIVVFWHECLPAVPVLWWEARKENPSISLNALISRHRDGRMIAGILRRWDIGSIDGSSAKAGKSNKGGRAAMRAMLRLLREGKVVSLTPDGPRGPRRVMQPGAAYLAALSGVSVVPIASVCRPAWRIRSWDRMLLPLPFGRIRILCGAPIRIGRHEHDRGSAIIGAALDALDRRGDAP